MPPRATSRGSRYRSGITSVAASIGLAYPPNPERTRAAKEIQENGGDEFEVDESYALRYIYAYMYDTFQTLADPTRRSIVETLGEGERAVNEIVERLHIHQSGVSRHLRILHDAGFVEFRPDGPKRLYSLRPDPFHELDRWIAQYRDLWEGRLDRFAEELERRQATRGQASNEVTE